jgi:hypothetical protein
MSITGQPQICTAIYSSETRLIQREITKYYTIKVVMMHPHAWNWDTKGGRNLCYKHNQQNQVHEHPCKEMEKICEDM